MMSFLLQGKVHEMDVDMLKILCKGNVNIFSQEVTDCYARHK